MTSLGFVAEGATNLCTISVLKTQPYRQHAEVFACFKSESSGKKTCEM